MNIKETHGALIGDVDPKGPAAHANLQAGDVIVAANGKPVENQRELRLMVSDMAPGTQVNLKVVHNNEVRNVPLTLGEVPAKQVESTEPGAREKPAPKPERTPGASKAPSGPHMGIALTDLTPDILQHLKLPAGTKGAVIADVQEGSAASEAGLQVGDIIQQVDRKTVQNVADFKTDISAHRSGPVLLLIAREGHTLFVAVDTD
jgi:serine protease Do